MAELRGEGGSMRRQVRRVLDVPVDGDRLWAEVADPARLGAWLGGRFDVRLAPGEWGQVHWPDGGRHLVVVDEVAPRRRVRWLWAPVPGPHDLLHGLLGEDPAPGGDTGWTVVTLRVERIGEEVSRLTVDEVAADEPATAAPLGLVPAGASA